MHIPVLAKEVIDCLQLKPGETVLDATLGLGGHSSMILREIGNAGTLIAVERDSRNLELARKRLASFEQPIKFIHDSFGDIDEYSLPKLDAALFDLGFSSEHVDDASRGFSFMKDGPLDMRYDQNQELTAERIVNGASKDDLADIFRKYGEEVKAREIAKAILEARKKERITTTKRLADIVYLTVKRRGKAHPATKVFQALRIAVNDELGEVEKGINSAVHLLKSGGRIAIISFHSLEDRLVKQMLNADVRMERLTKKPIVASWSEKKSNPRSRSAKLRIYTKI
ncbi:16S rRNA (cytosine(1402)-N(4))-methyltransferase RsmH [Patescibacteria group bacterium]|nr:16S rRNA (cytosine(1402)-N(4))-methyltransferase RsmH [Patescibacteria group bacterium]